MSVLPYERTFVLRRSTSASGPRRLFSTSRANVRCPRCGRPGLENPAGARAYLQGCGGRWELRGNRRLLVMGLFEAMWPSAAALALPQAEHVRSWVVSGENGRMQRGWALSGVWTTTSDG